MNRYLWALLCAILLAGCKQEQIPPNVLLIVADDLGWTQLGCYGGAYYTPAIDSLAVSGMRFTEAYSSAAVCSPTRAALMTGKYPARLHLTDFIKGQSFPDSLLMQPDWQKFLPLEELTLAELFKEKGYRTAIFGKWHLSCEKQPPESAPYNPDKQGFDDYMVTYKPVQGQTDPGHDPHNVDSITLRSVQFLKQHGNEPFFLVVSHNAIHDPVMENWSRVKAYSEQFPESDHFVNPALGAMVNRLDEGSSLLLRTLDELGLVEHTIVVFCSDNGGKEAHASQYPLRKGKGWLYEGGIRVPLIVRWPGHIKPGSTSTLVTSTIDLFPTLIELAGFEKPDISFDGISMAAELLGTGRADKELRQIQYWHYPHYHMGSGMKPASAIRDGRYKLIEWHEALLLGRHAWELYDLEADPGETRNLSWERPELLDSLRHELHNWRKETGSQMPTL